MSELTRRLEEERRRKNRVRKEKAWKYKRRSRGGIRRAIGSGGPENTVAPAVTGTLNVGDTLSCTTGTWTGTAPITYTYQWYRALVDGGGAVILDGNGNPTGTPIVGATASTYVLVSGDVGSFIFCTVTASNGAGSATADSNVTATTVVAVAVVLDSSAQAAGGTISGSGLTWADDATTWGTVRATASASSGKKAFKVHFDSDGFRGAVGFANAAFPLKGSQPGQEANPSNAFSVTDIGTFNVNTNAAPTVVPSFTTGDTMYLVADFDTFKLWASVDNGVSWNPSVGGAQDPVAGTGGLSFAGTNGGPWFPIVSTWAGIMTAQFTGFTPPTGVTLF